MNYNGNHNVYGGCATYLRPVIGGRMNGEVPVSTVTKPEPSVPPELHR